MRAALPIAPGLRALTWCAGLAALCLLVTRGPLTSHAAVLLVLAPITEETVFRGGLHESLLRRLRSRLAANVLTALAFGLVHVAVRGHAAAFAVAAPALLIGLVYGRTRTLWPCVVLHAAMNAIWLAV